MKFKKMLYQNQIIYQIKNNKIQEHLIKKLQKKYEMVQIKMFLTRMGLNTKMIVTGDMTQIDLPYSQKSGLKDALEVLKNVKGIAKVEFDVKDIVRHKLVQRIVEAYEKSESKPLTPKGEKEKNEKVLLLKK